jgi:hypothetical protein
MTPGKPGRAAISTRADDYLLQLRLEPLKAQAKAISIYDSSKANLSG